MSNREEQDIGKILDSLVDSSTKDQIELLLLVEKLSEKLDRRQALIVRLLLLDNSQADIAKILGYSAPTISISIKKIRKALCDTIQEEWGVLPNKLYKKLKIKSKKETNTTVFNLEGDKSNGVKGSKGGRT